ncbi:MAG TPA: adenylosuccinate synthetase, partial [Plasticicumulans sp.]|nr:adenylosuccinate synthetase [Plasticicumulans sp.]
MHAHAVIGAGYGDEGKGAATDRLAAMLGPRALVVRHNGGAQAGHTVVAPDGRRHVFGHVGSGSFAGVPGYLSEYFVASPILCLRELAALASLGVQPQLYVDAGCAVTTPYDMLLNQAVEAARGAGRHGSCGVGFGETIERHGHAGFALTIADLRKPVRLRERLEAIRRDWLPARAAALGIDRLPAVAGEDALPARFIEDCTRFLRVVEVCDAGVLRGRPLIFEG